MAKILKKQNNNKTPKQLVKSTKDITIGNICDLKISAHVSKGVGIDDSSYGFNILVPNVQIGDSVKAKIVVVTKKYAIAKVVKITASKIPSQNYKKLSVGELVNVKISKFGPKSVGIAELANNYKLIILNAKEIVKGELPQTATVEISRIKANYGFAKIVTSCPEGTTDASSLKYYYAMGDSSQNSFSELVKPGSSLTLTLPKKISRLRNKYMVIKLKSKNNVFGKTTVFIKPALGAKLGDKVKIKMVKIFYSNCPEGTTKCNLAIAKIVELNPISSEKKKLMVKANIRQMLKSGMHFGEKAVKCNARMKNYVWLRKKGQNKNKPLIKKERNIINVLKAHRCLNKALEQLSKYAAKGKTFLFVGTKRAISGLISRAALFTKKAFFVNTRWLGGMLTNWETIKKSISKIRPILKEKQTILKEIVEKRQKIKSDLMQKTILLRKKSKELIKKGRLILEKLKNYQALELNAMVDSIPNKVQFTEKNEKLITKRKELIEKSEVLIETYKKLLNKKRELILKSKNIKGKAILISKKYKQLLNELTTTRKKLRELKSFLLVIQNIKQICVQQNQDLYTVSVVPSGQYDSQLKDFRQIQEDAIKGLIPNPPTEIFNKIREFIKNYDTSNCPEGTTDNSNPYDMKTPNDYEVHKATNNKSVLTKSIMLDKLLGKFTLYVSHIKNSIKALNNNIKDVELKLNDLRNTLSTIKSTIVTYDNVKNKLINELRHFNVVIRSERRVIQILKRKLKQISAEKRLITFLPKLIHLPASSNKNVIAQTVQALMKRVVDPKLKYPMDSIYNRKLWMLSKKLGATRKKKWQRLEKYFGGIANMTKMKEQQIRYNVAIIVGQREEMNAVRECQKLGIKTFQIVDTNCNPSFADHVIPANDDSRNSIKYVLTKFVTCIRLAQKIRKRLPKVKAKKLKARR